jgi:hypothetical protein
MYQGNIHRCIKMILFCNFSEFKMQRSFNRETHPWNSCGTLWDGRQLLESYLLEVVWCT